MSASNLDFKVESFDFVYSDLAIHYIRDIGKVFSEVYKILKKNGIFLFSTTHPIEDTLEEVKLSKHIKLKILGYSKIGKKVNKVYGDYFTPRQIKNRWWEEDEVVFYYTPISYIINKAIRAGFSIQQVLEPKPIAAMKKAYPDFYKRMIKIPFIIIFKLKK
jgi:SAM-dependent methyltransferase